MHIVQPLRHRHSDGQALVLVALTFGVLITLIIGVNEIALRRRTQTRIQDSLDQAAALAVTHVEVTSLVADAPALLPRTVDEQLRTRLQSELWRVAAAVQPDPGTLARQAHVELLPIGGACHGHVVTAPAVCVDLTVTIVGVLGMPQVTFTTLAQSTRRP